jgi:hypothetical protein
VYAKNWREFEDGKLLHSSSLYLTIAANVAQILALDEALETLLKP